MEKIFTMDQVIAEAARCLLCYDAPCSQACPAGTQPDRFIRKVRFKNIKGAIATIKTNNPFGGVCGTICPTSCLCEEGCLASGIGNPIKIGKIQEFLVRYGWEIGFNAVSPQKQSGKKVAVVGAGPSGLTCAAELARIGYRVVVFEKESKAGGMLWYVIPEERLSKEIVAREIAEIESLGVQIRCNTSISTQDAIQSLFQQGFEAVYLATGAWKCIELDIPGRCDGVTDAISFLRLAKEKSTQFESLVKDKLVCVIGGGDSAIDAGLVALWRGAKDVFLLYRRSFKEMPASIEARELALREGVHLLFLTQPLEYVSKDGKVTGIRVARCRLGEPDESGRRKAVLIPQSEHYVPADVVVEALGLVPDDSVRGFSRLSFDSLNRIIVKDAHGATGVEGVYAGGDVVRGASLVVRAVGDGKKAASAIRRFLEGNSEQ